MTLTHNIYLDLQQTQNKNQNKEQISRMLTFPNSKNLIYAISNKTGLRYLYFEATGTSKITECNGISIGNVNLPEIDINKRYCELKQSHGSDALIFETIIEDIRKMVCEENADDISVIVVDVLVKWKKFFSMDKDIILSKERQQGLFGELLYLDKLINKYGAIAVSYWTGCKYETHDFYINTNAIEVKTTVTKEPYKLHINSEYQLDKNEVQGNLLVMFFALRKSVADGMLLVELINKIREALKNNRGMRRKFESNIEEYGFFDAVAQKYTEKYRIRTEKILLVNEDFPRIEKKELAVGISNCIYDLLVSACQKHEITEEEHFTLIKGMI